MKKIFVTWDDVQRQTTEILRRMQLENWKPDYIVGITRAMAEREWGADAALAEGGVELDAQLHNLLVNRVQRRLFGEGEARPRTICERKEVKPAALLRLGGTGSRLHLQLRQLLDGLAARLGPLLGRLRRRDTNLRTLARS